MHSCCLHITETSWMTMPPTRWPSSTFTELVMDRQTSDLLLYKHGHVLAVLTRLFSLANASIRSHYGLCCKATGLSFHGNDTERHSRNST